MWAGEGNMLKEIGINGLRKEDVLKKGIAGLEKEIYRLKKGISGLEKRIYKLGERNMYMGWKKKNIYI